jgi:hypothetical protein
MRKIKLAKVYYEYDSYHEESVVRHVLEGVPWTEVTDEKFEKLKELVKNKHKVKELRDFNLWLIEDAVAAPDAVLSVDQMISLYDEATASEKRAAEKRRAAEAIRKANKDALDLAKKKKLLEKLQKELGTETT